MWLYGFELAYAQTCGGGRRGALDISRINQLKLGPQSFISQRFKLNQHDFMLEIAETPAQGAQGLMGRNHLKLRTGMIFYSDDANHFEMNMKKTAMPLDMLFVGTDGRIACVIKNTTPFSTAHLSCKVPVMAVIEINAGEAQQYGLVVGLKLLDLRKADLQR